MLQGHPTGNGRRAAQRNSVSVMSWDFGVGRGRAAPLPWNLQLQIFQSLVVAVGVTRYFPGKATLSLELFVCSDLRIPANRFACGGPVNIPDFHVTAAPLSGRCSTRGGAGPVRPPPPLHGEGPAHGMGTGGLSVCNRLRSLHSLSWGSCIFRWRCHPPLGPLFQGKQWNVGVCMSIAAQACLKWRKVSATFFQIEFAN